MVKNNKMNDFDINRLTDAVGLACDASYVPNINKGREIIYSMPREWVIQNIEDVATTVLNLTDEWHYTRLLEVYKNLNHNLYEKLITFGFKSANEEIVEAAKESTE
jgi:hypothetical protein